MIPCTEENRLNRIESDVKDIKDSIENKKDGLFKSVILLTDHVASLASGQGKQGENIDKLTLLINKISESRIETKVKAEMVHTDMNNLTNIVSALRDTSIRTDAEDRLISQLTKEKIKRKQWLTGLAIATIVSVIGLIFSLWF